MVIKVNKESLNNDSVYQEFVKDNPGQGTLKVRVTSASEAIPVEGVDVVVSKDIGDNTYIFYEGKTDNSGMINNVKLPTPIRITNNLEVPKFTTYKLKVDYLKDKFSKTYEISLCCGSGLIQYVNITPMVNMEEGRTNGN